jgi:hypothetical protein
MIGVHVGNVDIHFEVVTYHKSLHVFVHDTTESQEDFGMALGFIEFLKAGSVTEKAGGIASITFDDFFNSVVKLLDLVFGPGNELMIKRNSTSFYL